MSDQPAHDMRPDVKDVYDEYVRRHHGEIDVGLFGETMFNAGARTTTRAMVVTSDVLPDLRKADDLLHKIDGRMHEILGLIEGMLADELEHERAIAWAESNANAEEHAIRDGDLEELPF